MILAVSREGGRVCPDMGATREFLLYDIQAGQVRSRTAVPVDGTGNGALALCLTGSGANAVLCGAIGGELRTLLSEAGIPVFAGAEGPCDACVAQFLTGDLPCAAPPACDGGCASCGHDCGGDCCSGFEDEELDRSPYLERP